MTLLLLVLCTTVCTAQTRSPVLKRSTKKGEIETEVRFELLMPKRGSGLAAQEWGRIFQKLKVPLRIKRPILQEKPDTKERKLGPVRQVTVLGKIEINGSITFKDRSFTKNDTAKLAEWIRDLKTFGAQGSPDGQPAFGLNKRQFGLVHAALSKPVKGSMVGLTLDRALKMIDVQTQFPYRLTVSAEQWIERGQFNSRVSHSHNGMSKGSALSIVLNNFGLGFRPKRTGSGAVELSIEPITEAKELWPIGWPLTKTRLKTAPTLFKMVVIDLDKVPLKEVFSTISKESEVPVYVDEFRLKIKGIDLDKMRVSVLPKKTSRIQVLRTVTNPNKMTRKLLIDEAGKPFVWVTVLQPSRVSRTRK